MSDTSSNSDPQKLTPGQRLEARLARKASEKTEKGDRAGGVEPLQAEALREASLVAKWLRAKQSILLVSAVGLITVAAVSTAAWWVAKRGRTQAAKLLDLADEMAARPVGTQTSTDDAPAGKTFATDLEKRSAQTKVLKKIIVGYATTPAAAWSYVRLAQFELEQNKAKDAYKLFARAKNVAQKNQLPAAEARALEGMGLAKESDNKIDEAARLYQQLAAINDTYAKNIADLHLARVELHQGKKAEAQKRLQKLNERLDKAALGEGTYLGDQARNLLAQIDPALVKPKSGMGGLGDLDPAQLQQLLRAMQSKGAPQ